MLPEFPPDTRRPLSKRLQNVRAIACSALLACLLGTPGDAAADSLEFIVDRQDGAVYIKNPNESAVVFDGYQFESFGAAFDVSNWTSIADSYDLDGDQSVDSTSIWLEGTAGPSLVEEASLEELSAAVAPGQIISLGLFFNTGLPEGGAVNLFTGTDSELIFPDFRTLTADYDSDLDVDIDDYLVFVSTFGSTIDLRADGNNDNIVNAADYTKWRDTAGPLAVPATLAPAFASAIPEPSSLAMLWAAAAMINPRRRRPCR